MSLQCKFFSSIAIELPEHLILSRLGYNHHLTTVESQQKAWIAGVIRRGFASCHLRGAFTLLPISGFEADRIKFGQNSCLVSRDFVRLAEGAKSLWLAAATAGREIVEMRDQATGAEAAILDAAGSECTDKALDFLQHYALRELLQQNRHLAERRFSPGYGDMSLDNQQLWFENLPMAELGIIIDQYFFMQPEKSVTAAAPVF